MQVPLNSFYDFGLTTYNPLYSYNQNCDYTPHYYVYGFSDTPIISGYYVQRNIGVSGVYKARIHCAAASGFSPGNWYSILSTASVSGITSSKYNDGLRIYVTESVSGVPVVDLWYVSGVPTAPRTVFPANIVQWSGVNVASPNTSGIPIVDIGYVAGAVQQITSYLDARVSQVPSGTLYYTIPEPSSVFGWEANLSKIAGWLGALSRNQITQTLTSQTLFNDNLVPIASGNTSDDGTTYTRSEWM